MGTDELHALFDKVAKTMDVFGMKLDSLAAHADAQREADRKEFERRKAAEAAERKAQREADSEKFEQYEATRRKEMKELRRELGGVGRSMGDATEEFFYNSLMAEPMLKGMRFDDVLRNQQLDRNGVRGEFDLVLLNRRNVFLGEVKHRAQRDHLEHLIEKQASRFRELFPEYGNLELHLGLASFHFSDGLIEECLARGVTVLRRVGKVFEVLEPPG